MRRTLATALTATLLALPAAAQSAPQIGPTFGTELAAAGCSDGVAWSADGSLTLDPALGDAARRCIAKVRAAHDPTRALPRTVDVSDLLDALTPSQRAAILLDHMQRLQARGAKGTVTAADAKVVRAAADIGIAPAAWVALVPAD